MIGLKKGDTLIEVMLAFSLFSMVMIGGITLMNAGISKAQSTLELTMARNAIDSQAEALRYINSLVSVSGSSSADVNLWNTITSASSASASDLSSCPKNKTSFPTNSFVLGYDSSSRLNINKSNLNPATTFPRLIWRGENDSNNLANKGTFAGSEGLWIETVKGSGYYDFHIRACWISPSNTVPTTLGTIVRLYDPR